MTVFKLASGFTVWQNESLPLDGRQYLHIELVASLLSFNTARRRN